MYMSKAEMLNECRAPIRILLAEDDDNDAFFFRRELQRHRRLELIWHAWDGDEVVKYLTGDGVFADRTKHPVPDVLMLDLKMPNRNGFEVLEWLGKQLPDLTVAVLTSTEDPQEMRRVQKYRACLIQTKNGDGAKLERFLHWVERVVVAERKRKKVG